MDFFNVLLSKKTGKPCKDLFDSAFAKSTSAGTRTRKATKTAKRSTRKNK